MPENVWPAPYQTLSLHERKEKLLGISLWKLRNMGHRRFVWGKARFPPGIRSSSKMQTQTHLIWQGTLPRGMDSTQQPRWTFRVFWIKLRLSSTIEIGKSDWLVRGQPFFSPGEDARKRPEAGRQSFSGISSNTRVDTDASATFITLSCFFYLERIVRMISQLGHFRAFIFLTPRLERECYLGMYVSLAAFHYQRLPYAWKQTSAPWCCSHVPAGRTKETPLFLPITSSLKAKSRYNLHQFSKCNTRLHDYNIYIFAGHALVS